MEFLKNGVFYLLEILGLYPEKKASKVSYLTLVAAVAFTWWFNHGNLVGLLILQVISFLVGALVVVIVKRLINGYLLQLGISSVVTIALLLAFESWRCSGDLQMAINCGEILFSWWGLFLYLPMIFSMLKFFVGTIVGIFDHQAAAKFHFNRMQSPSVDSSMSVFSSAKHFFLCIWDIILCILLVLGIIFFFYYGMCSLMIIRAIAELMKILDL